MTVNLQRELEKLVKLLLLTKLFALTRHLLLFLITFFFLARKKLCSFVFGVLSLFILLFLINLLGSYVLSKQFT